MLMRICLLHFHRRFHLVKNLLGLFVFPSLDSSTTKSPSKGSFSQVKAVSRINSAKKVRVDSFIIMFFVITNIKIYSNFCCFNTLKSKNMPIKKKINKNKIEFLILPVT